MTVAELRSSLEGVDDDKEVVVLIPLDKKTGGIIKDVTVCRPRATETMFILNIDRLNKIQQEQVIPASEVWDE